MSKLTRSVKITYQIIAGADVLAQGHQTARHLWNQLWWHQIGYNEKLRRQRGDDWDRFRRNLPHQRGEKYLGSFGLRKVIKDHWSAKNLSDRSFDYTVKDFDIAMRSWFSNLKTNPQARPPRYSKVPRLLNFEVGRNAKPVGEWTYRLTVLGGHIKERYATVRIRLKPGIKMKDIKLIRLQPDGSGVVTVGLEAKQATGADIAAIDLGIINLAVVAFQNGETILYSGKGLLASNQWYQKRAAACKPKNWRKGKAESHQSERFKQYRRKAGNIQKLAVHNLTRHIVNACMARRVGTIILGDLTGIRENSNHGKAGNQKLHNWPFAEIKRQIQYKAEEVGIKVIQRSERGTSRRHHLTGEKGIRSPRGLVTFKAAGQIINSDVNGAFGIMNNYLAEIGQPKVSPSPVIAGVGVEAALPGLPSPPVTAVRTGQVQSIQPTFVARFDLANWSIVQTRCNE